MSEHKVIERIIHSEKFGNTYRDVIERRCECCGEKKVLIREYEVKSDAEAMAEFFGSDA
jgi:hypothetical protein